MFNKNKFIVDYSILVMMFTFMLTLALEFRIKLFDSQITDSTKRSLKKMFMSGMKKRINSRVLLQNFIKRINNVRHFAHSCGIFYFMIGLMYNLTMKGLIL